MLGYGYSNRCLSETACTSNDKAGGRSSEDAIGDLLDIFSSTDTGGGLWWYYSREKRCVLGGSKIQRFDGDTNPLCIFLDHPKTPLNVFCTSLNILNILPDTVDTFEVANCVINTSLNLEYIDRPVQLVGAVLYLTGDGVG
jgi:hypothetical protein